MAFLENTNYYSNWDDMSTNDQYLSSVDKFMYNTSDTVWNNATGQKDLSDGGRDPRQSGQVIAGGGSGCRECGLNQSCSERSTCQGGCCIMKLTADSRGGSSRSRYNNASGCGYSNAAGGPSINVGGETFDMQPTLAWNQGDFFGQPQGFGASQTSCAPCPQGFQGDRQSCGGTGCYNSLGQRMYESGTGIPQGMSVQYAQL